MEKIIDLLNRYWVVVSIVSTILSGIATGGWYLKNRIEKAEATLTSTNEWVQTHDDSINQLHDDVLKLKEDERLREIGRCK
jgi:hypothetical protein